MIASPGPEYGSNVYSEQMNCDRAAAGLKLGSAEIGNSTGPLYSALSFDV